MYRHLYRNPTVLSRVLIKEFTNIKSEELAFRYAALAKLRTQELDFEALHQMDTIEHWEISKMSLLPQIFTLLTNLHRATRSDSLIQYPQIAAVNRVTALLDPNMFPVQDLQLKLHTSELQTIFDNRKQRRVVKNVGFKLNVRQSSIDHSDAGEGVFLETLPAHKSIPAGTLLGFVPGVLYDNYQAFGDQSPPDMHFFRFDGPILDFNAKLYYPYIPGYGFDNYVEKIEEIRDLAARSNIPYRNKQKGGFELVRGEDINPYAVGHKINHTPRNHTTNVCLIDIFIPQNFFPEDLMKFWPIQQFSTADDFLKTKSFLDHHYKNHIRGLGFISTTDIKDGEELFLDYLESCLFDMEVDPPDWLIKPPPMHPQITKCNLRKESLFMMFLEDYAFRKTKDGQNFDKFYTHVLREKSQFL